MIISLRIWSVSHPISGLIRMVSQRRAIRSLPGVTFAKLLGTGKGERFTPRDADLFTWGVLLVGDDQDAVDRFDNSSLASSWHQVGKEIFATDLSPIASHGKWAKQEPFKDFLANPRKGRVAAITRARLKAKESFRFWHETPPVTQALHQSPGLLGAIGIGEAPIGLQGTFSLWEDGESLRNFAYGSTAHRRAIALTNERSWYSEELFARFEVLRAQGLLGGRLITPE